MTAQATNYMKDWNAFVSEIKAVKSATNPHFKNKFTPLDAWLDEIHRLADKYNLLIQEYVRVRVNGEDIYQVHCIEIHHATGGIVQQSEYFISLIDKPQAMGAACTYARRYHIQTVLNCTGEDDDDGNTAQAQVTNTTTTVAMTGRRKVS